MLASASSDKTIKLWDIVSDTCTTAFEGHSGPVYDVTFSPDGTMLASASSDTTIKLWDTASGTCISTLEDHNDPVSSVVFSPDGTILASASYDNTIKLWDIASGTCTTTLDGHIRTVCAVTFSPDGTILASGSEDETIKLWDIASGTRTATVEVGADVVYLAFDTTGRALITNFGTFALSYLSPQELLPPPLSLPPFGNTIPAGGATSTAAPVLLPIPPPNAFPRRMYRKGIGLSEDCIWITWDSHKVLWLPPKYRPIVSAVTTSTLALGYLSGRVVVITISPGHDGLV
jgi:WD40 repeat protein